MENGITQAQERIINHAALVLATREVKALSGVTPYPDASVRATYFKNTAAVLLDDLQEKPPQKVGMPRDQAAQIVYGSHGEPPLHERIAAQIVAMVQKTAAELASSPGFLDEVRSAAGTGGWKLAMQPNSTHAVVTDLRSEDPLLAELRRFLHSYGATSRDSVCSSVIEDTRVMAIGMIAERGAALTGDVNPALLATASVSRNGGSRAEALSAGPKL